MDTTAWLNGQYVLMAIGVAFSKRSSKYPDKPNSQRDFKQEEAQRIHEYMKQHSEYMRERKKSKKQAEVKKDG